MKINAVTPRFIYGFVNTYGGTQPTEAYFNRSLHLHLLSDCYGPVV